MANNATISTFSTSPERRRILLALALDFVRRVHSVPGVKRLALLGSILTDKAKPKDIDILVTVEDACDR